MAGITDFLFNGQPPPSTTTYGSSTTGIPQFLSDYTQGLLSKSNAVAAEPYPTYQGARITPFSQDQNDAFGMVRDSMGAYNPALNNGISAVNTAAGMSPFGAGQGTLNAASGINAMGQAAPWMNAAGQSAPGMVGAYMNPYQDQVVNRIGELAGRNLSENLMPAIGDQFTRAGQFGSSRMQEATGKALRDTQESALAAQGNLLNQGYGQAMDAFQKDASRYANVGQTMGSLANTQQGNLANIGQVQGNLTSMGQKNAIDAGNTLGSLANMGQGMNLRDAAALEGVGQTQQGQQQKNLDLAYADFLQERDYPKTQLNFMNSMLRGIPYGTTTATSATGPANAYSPSPLAQLTSAYSLYSALNKAEGGEVRAEDAAPMRGEQAEKARAWAKSLSVRSSDDYPTFNRNVQENEDAKARTGYLADGIMPQDPPQPSAPMRGERAEKAKAWARSNDRSLPFSQRVQAIHDNADARQRTGYAADGYARGGKVRPGRRPGPVSPLRQFAKKA